LDYCFYVAHYVKSSYGGLLFFLSMKREEFYSFAFAIFVRLINFFSLLLFNTITDRYVYARLIAVGR
jgi:hypothetical protein